MEVWAHLCFLVCRGSCQSEWRCTQTGRKLGQPSPAVGRGTELAGTRIAWRWDPYWSQQQGSEYRVRKVHEEQGGAFLDFRSTVWNHTITMKNILCTIICASSWNWFALVRVTDADASLMVLVGWFITLIPTLMSAWASGQSWHSTNIFSTVPTRNKLGADITFLQWQERRIFKYSEVTAETKYKYVVGYINI